MPRSQRTLNQLLLGRRAPDGADPRSHSPLSVPSATVDLPDRMIQPMPTTKTHCYPNVRLPAGVAAVFDWRPNDPLPYRVVLGAGRGVTDHNVAVHTSAIQFADGRIDDGAIVAPSVTISHACYNGRGLSSTQARELAARLLEAADELDRWIESGQAASWNQIALSASG
jgi:hypothetical protein